MKITTLIFTTMIILALVAGGFFYYIAFYVGKEKPKEDLSSVDAREKRIVAFGDSLTFGYNIPQENSYPSQLQKKRLLIYRDQSWCKRRHHCYGLGARTISYFI
jgi:hypothetical protein